MIVVGILVIGAYFSQDDQAIETNNQALDNFDLGNNTEAIEQFKDAADQAVTDETKLDTLVNLAYVYWTDGQSELALQTFKEALALTKPESFDYHLLSGEIALEENNPAAAEEHYLKAYEMNPEDYQITNSLALFYLDLDSVAPEYTDYPKALTFAKKADALSDLKMAEENLAIAHYFNNEFDETIRLLKTRDFTVSPTLAIWLGLAYLGKDDEVNAKYYFKLGIENGADAPQEIIDYVNQE